jgi:predicted TIM-barrel fold metal-dependent hydrolase
MIIDVHAHLLPEPDYAKKLIDTAKRLGIDKICLSALGPQFNQPTNEDVKKTFLKYPDVIIGAYYLRLGTDKPDTVDKLYEEGFRMLKVTCPAKNYDDESYYPIYEKAERYKLPILFHTGMVFRSDKDKHYNVSSARMRPVFLDTIARAFPSLNMIGAHLGVPWHEEACGVARFNPNVYFDITGAKCGWRSHKTPLFFKEVLWWQGAFEKIVFGTDVHYSEVKEVINDYKYILNALNIDTGTQGKIFGETILRVLNIKP